MALGSKNPGWLIWDQGTGWEETRDGPRLELVNSASVVGGGKEDGATQGYMRECPRKKKEDSQSRQLESCGHTLPCRHVGLKLRRNSVPVELTAVGQTQFSEFIL